MNRFLEAVACSIASAIIAFMYVITFSVLATGEPQWSRLAVGTIIMAITYQHMSDSFND